MTGLTVVAPREISDLVYRVSRCTGCSSGTADLIAENVRFGEVFYGGAIEVFLAAVDEDSLKAFINTPDLVLNAEVEKSTSLVFVQPVPFAAFGATLWQSAQRGWAATNIDHGSLKAGDRLAEVAFVKDAVPPGCIEAINAAELARSVEGVAVGADAFRQLYNNAKAFLVSEAVLDTAATD